MAASGPAFPSVEPILRAADRTERRLRLQRALSWTARGLVAALLLSLLTLVSRKTGVISEHAAWTGLAIAWGAVLVVALVGYARRLPDHAGAVRLDGFHALSDRLSSALAFASLPGDDRTPWMVLAVEDALEHVGRLDPKRAVVFRVPKEWPLVVGLLACLGGIAAFEVRTRQVALAPQAIEAVDVTADDLDAMREFLRDATEHLQTEEAKAATQEFNQLIDDLAERRLDRAEAFRRMEQLENRLLSGREVDRKSFEEALRQMSEELRKSELSKPAAEALANANLSASEAALRELAKKVRASSKASDKAALDRLREALRKAGENQAARAQKLDARRDELKEQLLKQRKAASAGQDEEEKRLLQKRERELERLDRQAEEQRKSERQLDRLDRELQKAAEDLAKDLGLSADDLDRAAEDMNRMAREQMSQEEKEQLRQRLEELRENLRRQGQGGQGAMARLRKFQQRARGQGGQQGQGGGKPEGQGQGQGEEQGGEQEGQGQGGQGSQRAQGDGAGEAGRSKGQGSQGQGAGGAGESWILGPNGERIMVLSASRQSGAGSSGAQGKGSGAGHGHDPAVQGRATQPNMGTQDTHVAGNDTGQGGSRSEVILGAAERGFASRGYEKVFREYETVAEEALHKDEIPGGYRFYVRRYFELIRPRDGGSRGAPTAPADRPRSDPKGAKEVSP